MLESEKEPLAPAELEVLGPRHARLKVTEGRYHQARRMFVAAGNHVETLQRISVGATDAGRLCRSANGARCRRMKWQTLFAD